MRKPCDSSFPQIVCLLYICKDCQLLFLFWRFDKTEASEKGRWILFKEIHLLKQRRPELRSQCPSAVSHLSTNHPPLPQSPLVPNHYLYYRYSEEALQRRRKCNLRYFWLKNNTQDLFYFAASCTTDLQVFSLHLFTDCLGLLLLI